MTDCICATIHMKEVNRCPSEFCDSLLLSRDMLRYVILAPIPLSLNSLLSPISLYHCPISSNFLPFPTSLAPVLSLLYSLSSFPLRLHSLFPLLFLLPCHSPSTHLSLVSFSCLSSSLYLSCPPSLSLSVSL